MPMLMRGLGRLGLGAAVSILVGFAVFPILWMLSVSLQLQDGMPPWANYLNGWRAFDFPRYFAHSLILCGGTVLLSLLIAVPAGYALRHRLKLRIGADLGLAATQMIPQPLLLLPLFMAYVWVGRRWGWPLRGSYEGLILAYTVLMVPVATWMLRHYFEAIPMELEEAACLDGCTAWGVLWRVALPLAAPGVLATGFYIFILSWNEVLFASVLSGETTRPFSLQLLTFQGQHRTDWGQLMALGVMVNLPLVAAFWGLHRRLVQGLRLDL